MLTYAMLTPAQQTKAAERLLTSLLKDVVEGTVRFDDPDMEARIDKALASAQAMRTPWFAHEYVMEDCGDTLRQMAQAVAEMALYPEPHETVVLGIAEET